MNTAEFAGMIDAMEKAAEWEGPTKVTGPPSSVALARVKPSMPAGKPSMPSKGMSTGKKVGLGLATAGGALAVRKALQKRKQKQEQNAP